MRLIHSLVFLTTMLTALSTQAASPYAGQEKAAVVCAQCHGIRATSADAPYPALAGRDAEYLKTALKQYRNKIRQSDVMNAIAGALSDDDINNLASYYSNAQH